MNVTADSWVSKPCAECLSKPVQGCKVIDCAAPRDSVVYVVPFQFTPTCVLFTVTCRSQISPAQPRPTLKRGMTQPPFPLTRHGREFRLSQWRYLGWIDSGKEMPVLPILSHGDGEPGANRNTVTNFGEAGGGAGEGHGALVHCS